MPNRILLINPWIHDFAAFDLWSKPLGLLYVGSTLNHFGYKVDLVDCLHWNGRLNKRRPNNTGHFYSEEIEKPLIFHGVKRRFKRYGMPIVEFHDRIREFPKPMLICVTSHMTYWYPGVFEAIKILKAFFHSVPVVLGGIYASLCYKHAKANSGADYIIKGPGELEVLKLADNLAGIKRGYSIVNAWIDNEIRPDYELYPKLNSVSILTSRGCPFRCAYCASFILNRKFNLREPDIVVEEVEGYVKRRLIKDIAFYDDALFVDKKKTHNSYITVID